MEYEILEATSIEALKAAVMAKIAEDAAWVPQGGIAVDDYPRSTPPYNERLYIQAMIKPAATPPQ